MPVSSNTSRSTASIRSSPAATNTGLRIQGWCRWHRHEAGAGRRWQGLGFRVGADGTGMRQALAAHAHM